MDTVWYVREGGEQFGPYSLAEIERCLRESRILPQTAVRATTDIDWRPLSEIEAFRNIVPEWLFVSEGLYSGPYTLLDLRELRRQGRIDSDTLVKRRTDERWTKAALVEPVASLLREIAQEEVAAQAKPPNDSQADEKAVKYLAELTEQQSAGRVQGANLPPRVGENQGEKRASVEWYMEFEDQQLGPLSLPELQATLTTLGTASISVRRGVRGKWLPAFHIFSPDWPEDEREMEQRLQQAENALKGWEEEQRVSRRQEAERQRRLLVAQLRAKKTKWIAPFCLLVGIGLAWLVYSVVFGLDGIDALALKEVAWGGITVSIKIAAALILALVLIFSFWLGMLIHCLKHEPSQGNDKIVWVMLMIFLSVFGAILYCFVERPRLRRLKRACDK